MKLFLTMFPALVLTSGVVFGDEQVRRVQEVLEESTLAVH
jgi:hypothetical protein